MLAAIGDGEGEEGDGEGEGEGDEEVGHDTSLPCDHDMPLVLHVAPEQVASVKLLQVQASEFVGNPLARFKLLIVGTDGVKPET